MASIKLAVNLPPSHVVELRRQCVGLRISPSEFVSQCVTNVLAQRILNSLPPMTDSADDLADDARLHYRVSHGKVSQLRKRQAAQVTEEIGNEEL